MSQKGNKILKLQPEITHENKNTHHESTERAAISITYAERTNSTLLN
jgi:hypothetical protein